MEREGRKRFSSLKQPKSKVFAAVKPPSSFSGRLQRIKIMKSACLVGNRDTASPYYLTKKEQCLPKKQKTKPGGGKVEIAEW